MKDMFHLIFTLAAVLFPFAAMWLLWRRMKRVRDNAYRDRQQQPHVDGWQEGVAARDGLTASHVNEPNEELIALGDRARHSNWPISNP